MRAPLITWRLALVLLATVLSASAPAENSVRFANVAPNQTIWLEKDHTVQIEAHLDEGEFEKIIFRAMLDSGTPAASKTNIYPIASPYQFTWRPYTPGRYGLYAIAILKNTNATYHAYLEINVLPAGAPVAQISKPYSGTSVGGSATYSVSPVSRGPCTFQWLFNGEPIPNATNNQYTVENIQVTNILGQYQVRVDNFAGRTYTPPVQISASIPNDNSHGGGRILFDNHSANVDAPIRYDSNNELAGELFIAEIWAGPSATQLSRTYATSRIKDGYIRNPGPVSIPSVAPGQKAFVQIAVWRDDLSYYDALYRGFWGKSQIIEVTTGSEAPAELIGLQPFKIIYYRQYNVTTWPFIQTDGPAIGSRILMYPGVYYYFNNVKLDDSQLTFQWHKNSIPIPGATQRTLTLDPLSLEDAGFYSLVVTDGLEVRTVDYTIKAESVPEFSFIDGQMQISGGLPGSSIAIQSTEDFSNWQPWETITASGGPATIPLPIQPGPPKFFRANFAP